MRELTVAKRAVVDETGEIHHFEYLILINEVPVAPGIRCESYGVKIAERDGEGAEIADITPSSDRIEQLLDLLVRNTVTPCTLSSVVEDWL